jgi:hypothetical protein
LHMKEEVINKTLIVPSLLTQSLVLRSSALLSFLFCSVLFCSACLLCSQFAHVIWNTHHCQTLVAPNHNFLVYWDGVF